jgi:hypothetical protein
MSIQKYSVNQHPVQTILSWIQSGEIAIPEIQRPFVWNSTKVRDFIDSLYQGYPVGYLIAWRNPTVRLKDGTTSHGKRILIDGQQRVTALMAAILGLEVIDADYRRGRITIAFHPGDKKFEVSNPAINKDKSWLPDISRFMGSDSKMLRFVRDYCDLNEDSNQDDVFESLELLKSIVNNPIGLIDLNSDLDIETVTDIFIRINSQGVILSQADFAMSKIAANEIHGGHLLRKCIDYFCHLAKAPEFYPQLVELDSDFTKTKYFAPMQWLRNENDDLYDPTYTDMLRVSFTSEFTRGRLQDLVALLSGRNFETRTYEEEIAEASFERLGRSVIRFMNETHFKRFLMIVRSAGFIDSSMIRSQNVLNFAYISYLYMARNKEKAAQIEKTVRRWLVMSMLTSRYSGSAEGQIDLDIRRIHEIGIDKHLANVEDASLSDAFWNAGLPQSMNTSVVSSAYFSTFLAAQVKANDKGFLSRDITVRDLIDHRGDVHHLFPKNYLKKHSFNRSKYNQIANFAMMQSEINISIGDRAPGEYFSHLIEATESGKHNGYGAIRDPVELSENFAQHCIPDGMDAKDANHYDSFLDERRSLMAAKIRDYYRLL